MDDKFFLNSPSQSPFKTGLPSTSINADFYTNKITPVKKEPLSFSPFKTSGLSPFKLINFSPNKESYDEWDKDFIASFEENLFGMEDGVISPQVAEELIKSPAGKALLENRSSPLRMKNGPAVRRLKISPQNKNMTRSFQPLSQSKDSDIENIVNQDFVIKQEATATDFLYGQTMVAVNANTLSAIDPNKMSATPIKPGQNHSDSHNVPKRKLAMKIPGQIQPIQAYVIQDNALSGIQQVQKEWPSKERLKYARMQFQRVLNMAVEREIQLLRDEKVRKDQEKDDNIQTQKGKSEKETRGGKGKSKGKGKKTKNDKYPQIKMALSKTSGSKKRAGNKSYQISKRLFTGSSKRRDVGWYPDDDNEEEEEEDAWTGPVPFNAVRNNYLYGEEEDSSEDEDLRSYKFETQSGRRVTWKKRRLY